MIIFLYQKFNQCPAFPPLAEPARGVIGGAGIPTLVGMLILFFLCVSPAFADLTINLIAVNASQDETKEIEIKHYLPKELKAEDIIDSGTLGLDYDVDKGAYFVQGMVVFQPKESKTFKITVKDVWRVTREEINILKNQLGESLRLLGQEEDYENYDEAQAVKDGISRQLDAILGQQENYSEDIARRIEEYRAHSNALDRIRTDIYDPTFLKREALIRQKTAGEKTVQLVIEVRNPSRKKERTVRHKHYLPKEVRSEDVVQRLDFDVRFDQDADRAFLTKEETFLPGEVKKYKILIRDIWVIPLAKIDALEGRAEFAMGEIQKSEYLKSGQFLLNKITKTLQQIRIFQEQEVSISKHIGIFRVNEKRYEKAERDVEKLEKMVAIVKAKKLQEFEKRKVQNVLKKLKALKGLAALSEALFKKGVSVDTTWRVIMITLTFVFFFTGAHFFRWSKRSSKMGEEEAGEGIKVVPKPEEEKKSEE